MDVLTGIQNWLEEFKSTYKPLGIYPPPKDFNNPEEFFWEIIELYGGGQEEYATLGLSVNSLEELGILTGYLRGKPDIELLGEEDFEFNRYSLTPTKYYKSPEEFYGDQHYKGINGTEISIKIHRDHFEKFWNDFIYEFMLPLKYLPEYKNN